MSRYDLVCKNPACKYPNEIAEPNRANGGKTISEPPKVRLPLLPVEVSRPRGLVQGCKSRFSWPAYHDHSVQINIGAKLFPGFIWLNLKS